MAFPGTGALYSSFSSSNPVTLLQQKTRPPLRSKYEARSELYGTWSVSEDARAKANQLSDKAVNEFDKASAAAQAKTGQIEMYSPKFYAACTFGGLLACVRLPNHLTLDRKQSSNPILLVRKLHTSTRLDFTLPPPPLPNLSLTSPSAHSRPSKSACRLQSHLSPDRPLPAGVLSLLRKDSEGFTKVCIHFGVVKFHTQ